MRCRSGGADSPMNAPCPPVSSVDRSAAGPGGRARADVPAGDMVLGGAPPPVLEHAARPTRTMQSAIVVPAGNRLDAFSPFGCTVCIFTPDLDEGNGLTLPSPGSWSRSDGPLERMGLKEGPDDLVGVDRPGGPTHKRDRVDPRSAAWPGVSPSLHDVELDGGVRRAG